MLRCYECGHKIEQYDRGYSDGAHNPICALCYRSYYQCAGTPPVSENAEEEGTDKATQRLIDDALKTHGRKSCPVCGYRGHFIRTALVCDLHGPFGGF